MNSVAKFADEAEAFEHWLLSGTDQDADATRQCLIRLLELYPRNVSPAPVGRQQENPV